MKYIPRIVGAKLGLFDEYGSSPRLPKGIKIRFDTINTPASFQFFDGKKAISPIMVQLEVAERLVAKPNTKDYGAITPAIDYRATAKIIKKVGRHMFTPVPNVDSAIVKIDFDNNKFNINNTII